VPPPEQGPGEERPVVKSFIKLAMIQLMFHRLHPSGADAEFHYRDAA